MLEWAEKLGVKVRSLAVRPMRNKWASCSTAGNLNFNVELISTNKKSVITSSSWICCMFHSRGQGCAEI